MKLLYLILTLQSVVSYIAAPNSFHKRTSLSFALAGGIRSSNRRTQTKSASTCTEKPLDDERSGKTFLSRWYDKYLDVNKNHPYPTKAISAGVVVGAGAVLSQWVQAMAGGVSLVIDWHLVRSFALTGLMFEGPYLHWWYEQLFKFGRFLNSEGVSSRKMTVAQIAIDETVGVVIFFPAYFFAYEITQSLLLLRAPSLSAVGTRLSSELLNVVKTNYIVWPLTSYIIFRRVPEALRVLASSIVAVFWNAYLCSRIA